MYFTFLSVVAQTINLFDVFLPPDEWGNCDNIEFLFKFSTVKISFAGFIFGQRIVQTTMSSPPLWHKNQSWSIHQTFQQQQVVNMIPLIDSEKKETFQNLKISALTRKIEASLKIPAGAGNLPPLTCGNCRQSLPAKIFVCVRKKFYMPNKLLTAIANKFACTSFTMLRKHWTSLFLRTPVKVFSLEVWNVVLLPFSPNVERMFLLNLIWNDEIWRTRRIVAWHRIKVIYKTLIYLKHKVYLTFANSGKVKKNCIIEMNIFFSISFFHGKISF